MLLEGLLGQLQGRPDLWTPEGGGHAVLAQPIEQYDRVVPGRLPQLRVESLEGRLDPGFPGPGKVERELLEQIHHVPTFLDHFQHSHRMVRRWSPTVSDLFYEGAERPIPVNSVDRPG